MTIMKDTTDKRDSKAISLIEAGKVHLVLGQRFGYVDGSRGQLYRVNRDGCECADWLNRQPEGGCAHQRALRWICGAYRMMIFRAKRHGRTRLPAALGRALRSAPVGGTVIPFRPRKVA